MIFSVSQIIAHLVGDYCIQSDWMANEKTSHNGAAAAHAATYTVPFLFITHNPFSIAFILITHFLIDRFRLARYLVWLKNFLAPRRTLGEFLEYESVGKKKLKVGDVVTWERNGVKYIGEVVVHLGKMRVRKLKKWWHYFKDCNGTGYHKERPAWLAVWLMIIADNTLHLLCNGFAIWMWP